MPATCPMWPEINPNISEFGAYDRLPGNPTQFRARIVFSAIPLNAGVISEITKRNLAAGPKRRL